MPVSKSKSKSQNVKVQHTKTSVQDISSMRSQTPPCKCHHVLMDFDEAKVYIDKAPASRPKARHTQRHWDFFSAMHLWFFKKNGFGLWPAMKEVSSWIRTDLNCQVSHTYNVMQTITFLLVVFFSSKLSSVLRLRIGHCHHSKPLDFCGPSLPNVGIQHCNFRSMRQWSMICWQQHPTTIPHYYFRKPRLLTDCRVSKSYYYWVHALLGDALLSSTHTDLLYSSSTAANFTGFGVTEVGD